MSLESLFPTTKDQDVQESNMSFHDLDLLLSSQGFQHDMSLQLPGFSFDASEAEVPTLAEGSLPSMSDPNHTWDSSPPSHPQVDASHHLALQILTYHVQSLDTQVRSLDARVQTLEGLHQQVCNTIKDFTGWSEKMEKHHQKMDNTVMKLSGMVRAILEDGKTVDGPAERA